MSIVLPFTIYNAGVENSLAGWGLDDLQFSDNDFAPGVVEFTAGGRAVDASDLFAYGSRVLIFQNRNFDGTNYSVGTCWFDGRVEPWTREGTAGSEDCIGRLVNAWWYFERLQFKMQFIRTTAADGTTVTYTTNRVLLGVQINSTSWIQINTGQQIANAVNWAISQGAPVTLGNVAPWAPVLSDFQKCITVAQVIQKMWHIESDFICVWDYSTVGTNPAAPGTPTIHFLKTSITNLNPALTAPQKVALALTARTVNLDAGNYLSKIKITPRPDWIKSYVHIDYDYISTLGQAQYLLLGSDQYPVVLPTDIESKLRGVDLYFDLAGGKVAVTNEQGNLTTAPFDITSLATWQLWKSELTAPTISMTIPPVIVTASTTPAATTLHPAPALTTKEVDASGNPVAFNPANGFEVLDGAYSDWMADPVLMPQNGYPVISAQKVKATAWVLITYQNGAKTYKQITKEFTAISYNTNFAAQVLNVSAQLTTLVAEPQPVGLAQIMYNAWRSLAVEGSFTTLEQEIGATAPQFTRAQCLNFTSAALAPHVGDGTVLDWSAVNAPVRRVSGSAVKGTCTVEFGAPLHLSANSLVDILRASRVRLASVDLDFFFGGPLRTGGGTVKPSRKTHAHSAEHGADEPQVHVVSAPDNTVPTMTHTIMSDATSGQLTIVQQPTAGGAPYTTAVIPPRYNGTGAPAPATLAVNAAYALYDEYQDTTANALYVCTAPGNNATSVWKPLGGGSGWNYRGAYIVGTYNTNDVVQCGTGTSSGLYFSTIDGNTNAPDSGFGWVQLSSFATWL